MTLKFEKHDDDGFHGAGDRLRAIAEYAHSTGKPLSDLAGNVEVPDVLDLRLEGNFVKSGDGDLTLGVGENGRLKVIGKPTEQGRETLGQLGLEDIED